MPNRITASLDYIFQKIASGAPKNVDIRSGTMRSREWFRKAALDVTQVDAVRATNRADAKRKQTSISQNDIGHMFMFWYDAKLKDELPFWDKLPLIFPIETYKDGFLGVNLHYLPPVWRAKLMDAMYTTMNNKQYDETTKLQIRYRILKSAAKFNGFRPCVKRYLNGHVRSKFIRIDVTEWDMALMMPTERFQKARKQTVWADSLKQINGGR